MDSYQCSDKCTFGGNTGSGARYTFASEVTVTSIATIHHVNGCSGFTGTVDGKSLGGTSGPCQNKANSKYVEQEACYFSFDTPQSGLVFEWSCTVVAAPVPAPSAPSIAPATCGL